MQELSHMFSEIFSNVIALKQHQGSPVTDTTEYKLMQLTYWAYQRDRSDVHKFAIFIEAARNFIGEKSYGSIEMMLFDDLLEGGNS